MVMTRIFRRREREQGRQEGLQEGRQEGLQEGRQEGLQEGRQEGLQEALEADKHRRDGESLAEAMERLRQSQRC